MLKHIRNPRGRLAIAFCLAVLAALGLWKWLYTPHTPVDPLLFTPKLALERIDPGADLYYDRAAKPEIERLKPALLAPDDRTAGSERSQSFARAQNNPALWRELDRRYRFGAVLLTGDPRDFHPLLDHLLASADWRLSYLDHTSLIFRRGPGPKWKPADLEVVRAQFAKSPVANRVEFLVQAANRMLAASFPQEAKALFEEATDLDKKSAAAWTGLALYYIRQTQWATALERSDRALAASPGYEPAMMAKAQVLYAMGKFNDAYEISSGLAALRPRDPTALFLHARIAHEARAFESEIVAMRRLVDLALAEGQPVTGYRIYLGQAYASNRQAQPAVEQFQLALANSDVTPEQRDFLKEAIARIKSRVQMP